MEIFGLEEIKTAIREKTRTELVEIAMELYQMAYESARKSLEYEKAASWNKAKINYLESIMEQLQRDSVIFAVKQNGKNDAERKALAYEFLKETSYNELVKELNAIEQEMTGNNYLSKKYREEKELYENWARLLELLITTEEELA